MDREALVVVPHNSHRGEMGGGKQKNRQEVDGRNRRVLRDIGNLVTAPAVDAKAELLMSCPSTWSFCAQLIANAQAEKNKELLAEVVKKVPAKKKDRSPAHETVVVISSDEESPLSRSKAKKTGKTLTSTLTARSKAASGLSHRPKNEIDDIDAADANNHLAVVEYAEDMYKFFKLTEDDGRVTDYMDFQPELNHKMRAILVVGS